jgi:hypothetical protein
VQSLWGAKEIHITENGCASDDDTDRIVFLRSYLTQLQRATADGVPVKGYFHRQVGGLLALEDAIEVIGRAGVRSSRSGPWEIRPRPGNEKTQETAGNLCRTASVTRRLR